MSPPHCQPWGTPGSASPPLPSGILMFSPAERNPRNAPSPAGFAPAEPAGAASPEFGPKSVVWWVEEATHGFSSWAVLGSLGSAAEGHELLCAVQLSLSPHGAAKSAAPRCRDCASLAGNSRLFNLLNYWQIPAANNPWLANDLQTACGRRFALGGWFCVGCVRQAAEPARGLGIAFAGSTLLLDKY